MRPLTQLVSGIIELLWPPFCAACREPTVEDRPLCPLCTETLYPIEERCDRCGLPLASASICLGCVRRPPLWESAHAPFVYGGQLAVAIRNWKLSSRAELTRPLANLLAPALTVEAAHVDAIVPVPLHRKRLIARGFNQASLLARAARRIARLEIPVEEWLDREHDTPSQASVTGPSRRQNVIGAFRAASRVKGRSVLLIDDVLTTGATAESCARALYLAGAARVTVLTLARALP